MASFPFFEASQSTVDFVPQQTQDSELLQQLGFVPGLKDILMLRQVHALEHATVWVLSESHETLRSPAPFPMSSFGPSSAASANPLGGMSTSQGFYLYGDVTLDELRQAVHRALQRIVSGEWDLAVHPRCGTNLSVGMAMAAGFALGMHLLLPRGPIEQLLGFGLAATAASHLAPEVGGFVQRYITTGIPFNLSVTDIMPMGDRQGHRVHFVQVEWIQP
jgi:hypothetical protein